MCHFSGSSVAGAALLMLVSLFGCSIVAPPAEGPPIDPTNLNGTWSGTAGQVSLQMNASVFQRTPLDTTMLGIKGDATYAVTSTSTSPKYPLFVSSGNWCRVDSSFYECAGREPPWGIRFELSPWIPSPMPTPSPGVPYRYDAVLVDARTIRGWLIHKPAAAAAHVDSILFVMHKVVN